MDSIRWGSGWSQAGCESLRGLRWPKPNKNHEVSVSCDAPNVCCCDTHIIIGAGRLVQERTCFAPARLLKQAYARHALAILFEKAWPCQPSTTLSLRFHLGPTARHQQKGRNAGCEWFATRPDLCRGADGTSLSSKATCFAEYGPLRTSCLLAGTGLC